MTQEFIKKLEYQSQHIIDTNMLNLIQKCISQKDINVTNLLGHNLLMMSVQYKYNDLFDLLIENGININAKCANDYTLLILASIWNEADFVRKLIKKGANPFLKDMNNLTALDYAKMKAERVEDYEQKRRYYEIINLLEEYEKNYDQIEKENEMLKTVKKAIKL